MITVILLIYNNQPDDIYQTINSIISQKDINFDLVICDDHSTNNIQELVTQYLAEKNYTQYKYIYQPENVGTVKNLISAVKIAHGKYIKPISPGDFLVNENTLHNIVNFMEKGNYHFGFGKMYFHTKGDSQSVSQHQHFINPHNIKPYITHNDKQLQKNIIICEDFISGAAMFSLRTSLLAELTKLPQSVVYCEDFIQVQLALNNKYFHFMDDYIVNYESTQGISTQTTTTFTKSKVQVDYENYISYLNRIYKNKALKKRERLNYLNQQEKSFFKLLKKFVIAPELYLFTVLYRRR